VTVRKSPRAPVLIGSFDPMRRKDDAWVDEVRAAVQAINRAGGKARLVYKPMGVRKRFAWKYQAHGQRLRLEDASSVSVYLAIG
jgi:hypothetical protein